MLIREYLALLICAYGAASDKDEVNYSNVSTLCLNIYYVLTNNLSYYLSQTKVDVARMNIKNTEEMKLPTISINSTYIFHLGVRSIRWYVILAICRYIPVSHMPTYF